MKLEPGELIRFEALRLAKVQATAVSNLNQWSAVGGSQTSGNLELDRFGAAVSQLTKLSRIANGSEISVHDGGLLRQAIWHYLQTVQQEHVREREQLEAEVARDRGELPASEAASLAQVMEELKIELLSDSDNRMNVIRDIIGRFEKIARTGPGSQCPSVLFRIGWLLVFTSGDLLEAQDWLKQCVRYSEGAPTLTNWMSHRLLSMVSAFDHDHGGADYWMLQGATLRPSAFVLYEAGLYAGRNERKNDCRLLFTHALEMMAPPVLMVLADPDTQDIAPELFKAIIKVQTQNRTDGKKFIDQWAALALRADDAAHMLQREAVASVSLIKDHHRFTAELAQSDAITSGYMAQRSILNQKYLEEEAKITITNEYDERSRKVEEKRHQIASERAVFVAREAAARNVREAEIAEARRGLKKSSDKHRQIEYGCSISFGLGVAGIGAFLLISILSTFTGFKLGADSPLGGIVVIGGMIPVGLMMAAHVVHGFFSQRATAEVTHLMKIAEKRFQSKREEIKAETDTKVKALEKELSGLEAHKARAVKAMSILGISLHSLEEERKAAA